VRTIVSDVPVWGLVLLFVGGAMLVAAGGFVLTRRYDFRSPSTGADTYVSAFGTRASTLFGILLVFVIVSEYGSFQGATKTVRDEATGLAEIIRNTQKFPTDARDRIRKAVVTYADEVTGHEWPLMEDGQESDLASSRLDDIQRAIASFDPSNESDKAFFAGAVSNFDVVVNARRDRIAAAKEHIPGPLLALLFAGALVFVATMFVFSAARDSLLLALILLLAALVGAGLFATVVLDYPFSGSLAISPDAFHEGALKGLLRP
jgi:Protein of unknown function (DUF4239)